jgi:hypothetical protein
MELGGYVVPVKYSQLSDIDANEETGDVSDLGLLGESELNGF